jgi:hypothetical protein
LNESKQKTKSLPTRKAFFVNRKEVVAKKKCTSEKKNEDQPEISIEKEKK